MAGNQSFPELSSLAQEIIANAIYRNIKKGERITETSLTSALGMSRTPIRKALMELSENSFLESVPNKGYYFRDDPKNFRFHDHSEVEDTIQLYKAIARDRLTKQIPDVIQESQLIRRYNITRGPLKKTLAIIAEDGWIEKSKGYGWRFLQLIDSAESYRDSYELRNIIEPAAILSPRFNCDADDFKQMHELQVNLKEGAYLTLPDKEIIKTNAYFHELISMHSGNLFFHQTISRLNRLRLVLEMFQSVNRERVKCQAAEHIKILKLIIEHEKELAAEKLKVHLQHAKEIKLSDKRFPTLFND